MELEIGKLLGATGEPFGQRLTLYIPDKDRDENPIQDHNNWANEAQTLLTEIGGGATAFPPVDGTWRKPDGSDLWERTIIVFTYIDPDRFAANMDRLRVFLHRFGSATRQGKVVFEFDGMFWGIEQYDSPAGE